MFTSGNITLAILFLIIAFIISLNTNKKANPIIFKTTNTIGLIAALFCVVAGLNLLSGWEGLGDPELQEIFHEARGVYILIPLAIAFWPIILAVYGLGLGGIFLSNLKDDDK